MERTAWHLRVSAESTAEVIRRVPDRYRRYTEPTARALNFHRIPRVLLDELLDHGLPHARRGDDLLFCRRDLNNVTLRHRLRSPQRVALRLIAKALTTSQDGPTTTRELEVQVRCPAPGHPGTCGLRLSPRLTETAAVKSLGEAGPGHLRFLVRLPARPFRLFSFTAEQRALVNCLTELEYHHLPHALSTDTAFAENSGLADCKLASHVLAERAAEAGIPMRRAFGLLVGQHVANAHCWIEFREEGAEEEWVPLDPFYFTALARWEVLEPSDWPADRVVPGAYWRMGERPESLVTHQGDHIAWSLVTR